MKVSIITASFNNVDTITDTVNTVASQTHSDIEHLIIDGGSTDGTVEVVDALCRKVQILSEPDRGIYDALNKGIARATGDVIGFLAADDFFSAPDVLARVVGQFTPDVDGVYGNQVFVSQTDSERVLRYWRSGPVGRLKLGWMPPHQTLYLRREVYERLGLFDSDWKVSADYDFILRAFLSPGFRAVYADIDILTMRLGGTSTQTSSMLTKWREDLAAIRRNKLGGWPTLVAKNVRKVGQLRSRPNR